MILSHVVPVVSTSQEVAFQHLSVALAMQAVATCSRVLSHLEEAVDLLNHGDDSAETQNSMYLIYSTCAH